MTEHKTAPTINPTQQPPVAAFSEEDRKIINLVYILQGVGLLFGITWVAAVIINMIKGSEMTSELGQAHNSYQLRTGLWYLGLMLVSVLLSVVIVGFLLMIGVYIWGIYRVIKGYLASNDGKTI